MKIRIKCRPEDFVVEERVSLRAVDKGVYTVYSLKKQGWNTADAIRQVARAWELPYQDCAYGGKKDRWGLTTQYITIKGGSKQCLELKNILVEFLGYSDRQMGPDLIAGNFFKTVVRDLADHVALSAVKDAQIVADDGFVNYFDDQRFGGYDPIQGFAGEKLLKGHFNGVLKAYLVSTFPDDRKDEKMRRSALDKNWKNWQACLGLAKTGFEKRVFARLVNDPKAMLSLVEDIPEEDLRMAVSAYQSFLWNDVVRRLLISRGWTDRSYPGAAGDYHFFSSLKGRDYEYIRSMAVPHPAAKAEMPDKIVGKIYEKILAEREVELNMFNKMKTRKVFFKSTPRHVIVKPREVKTSVDDDELYKGRKKLQLEFFLPRGSYATMFLKRLFAEPA